MRREVGDSCFCKDRRYPIIIIIIIIIITIIVIIISLVNHTMFLKCIITIIRKSEQDNIMTDRRQRCYFNLL